MTAFEFGDQRANARGAFRAELALDARQERLELAKGRRRRATVQRIADPPAGEEQIDAVTAVSGSGPGYIFYLAQALCNAAQSIGLTSEEAELLVRETFRGTVNLWCSETRSVRELRDAFPTKGGGTEAAFETFEEHQLAERLRAGVESAWRRYLALSEE